MACTSSLSVRRVLTVHYRTLTQGQGQGPICSIFVIRRISGVPGTDLARSEKHVVPWHAGSFTVSTETASSPRTELLPGRRLWCYSDLFFLFQIPTPLPNFAATFAGLLRRSSPSPKVFISLSLFILPMIDSINTNMIILSDR